MSPTSSKPDESRLIEADSDVRLDSLVASIAGVSRTQAATLIATGQVRVDGRHEKASYKPRRGEHVEIWRPPPTTERTFEPEPIELTVVFEDEDLLVIDKAAGMVVHPAPGNWSGTLVNALLGRGLARTLGSAERSAASREPRPESAVPRAGLVHRLDKETSGLLLVAKNERAHRILAKAVADRRVIRQYAVLARGHLRSERVVVEKPLARDSRDRKRMAVVQAGKPAKTTFVRLARFEGSELLRATLHTGRTHQIRVHLASIGHPVVGDTVYGAAARRRTATTEQEPVSGRQFLHAAWLRLRHPSSGTLIDLRSPLPPDLRQSLADAARDARILQLADPLDEFDFYRDDA
ncbi:MAG TPA: RluA family pseudouridine synthase [Gemmatimonadaceae bacterium]|nr:RluA family pseudouridine synthase [Gemmatimonadaceae bacterium]